MKRLKTFAPWVLIGVLVVANIFVWGAVARHSSRGMTVAFLDVGQGDAVFIESPSGRQVLVDSGRNAEVVKRLGGVMPFYDRSIDMIIATHPDADHIGGFPPVLSAYAVDYVVDTGILSDSAVYRAYVEHVQREGADVLKLGRGNMIDLGGGAYIKVLFPQLGRAVGDPNRNSIIAQLIYGETEMLLTGDAPDEIERYLASVDGDMLASDVLKVGHHGSDTSTSYELLGFAAPRYAVISAGRDNPYGHPHPDVLDRLARFDIETLGTYTHGTIIFESNGRELTLRD